MWGRCPSKCRPSGAAVLARRVYRPTNCAGPVWMRATSLAVEPVCAIRACDASSIAAPHGEATRANAEEGRSKPPDVLVYQGKRSRLLRGLKIASFCNCSVSVLSMPLIVTADIAVPFTARVSMAATIGLFGLSTTGFLAWVSKPYTLRLLLTSDEAGQRVVQIDTVNVFGRVRSKVLPVLVGLDDAEGRPQLPFLAGATFDKGDSLLVNPFSTFRVGHDWYYVDSKGDVHHPELLEQLLGVWPPPNPESEHEKNNADDATN